MEISNEINRMAYEAGSAQCRNLIEAKENLIKVMQSLDGIMDAKHLNDQIKEIYLELEEMHERQKKHESPSP